MEVSKKEKMDGLDGTEISVNVGNSTEDKNGRMVGMAQRRALNGEDGTEDFRGWWDGKE